MIYVAHHGLSRRLLPEILHGSEVFIGKASKDEDVVCYFEPLVTQHMESSGSPCRENLIRKKDNHPFNPLG